MCSAVEIIGNKRNLLGSVLYVRFVGNIVTRTARLKSPSNEKSVGVAIVDVFNLERE